MIPRIINELAFNNIGVCNNKIMLRCRFDSKIINDNAVQEIPEGESITYVVTVDKKIETSFPLKTFKFFNFNAYAGSTTYKRYLYLFKNTEPLS